MRLAEPHGPKPPPAADCNSSGLVAFTAGGELLLWSRMNPKELRRWMDCCFCGSQSRSGMGDRPNPIELER